jgi:hypothetical protein
MDYLSLHPREQIRGSVPHIRWNLAIPPVSSITTMISTSSGTSLFRVEA